jgi:uncharacterized protein YdbL (DUF1318 family)
MSKTTPSSSRRAILAGLLLAPIALVVAPRVSLADPLDGPRSAGTVGEGRDGYAIARDGASQAERDLVNSINAQRRAFYEQRAKEEGVPVTDIQEIYRAAIFRKAPSGWWFQTDGGWTQK